MCCIAESANAFFRATLQKEEGAYAHVSSKISITVKFITENGLLAHDTSLFYAHQHAISVSCIDIFEPFGAS